MAKKKTNKEAKETPDASALSVAMASIRKKYPEAAVGTLSETEVAEPEIISTGSLNLDNALGCGGIALGRMYEIFGPEAGGKSTLTYSIIKQAIAKGYKCLFVDAERTVSKKFLESLGINMEYVVLVQGYTGEQNLDIAEDLLRTGEFAVCVVDSVTALLPTAEAEQDSIGDNNMGLQGRLNSKMCRNFTPIIGQTGTALLLINQLRSNIGSYGGGLITTGGNSIPFYCTGRIKVTGGRAKDSRIKDPLSGDVVGHRVTFEVVKNKLGTPFKQAEVDLIYGKGYDTYGEVLDLAVDMGLIDKKGAWFAFEGENFAQGRPKAVVYLTENEEFYQKVRGEVTKVLGLWQDE